MDKIKPSEVSEVLLQQLQGINQGQDFDEVGTVLTVSDGVARIYGLRNAQANELLEFENGTMAIVMNLEEDNVGCVLLGPTSGIKEGQTVKRTNRIASIRVNDNMLGRVINPIGQPIDGGGAIDLADAYEMPLDRKAPGVIYRQPVKQPLQTGIKAVDSMIPIGRGLRELIIGDRQTGKTAIAIDTIINQKSFYEAGQPVYCIYVAIGQKASTVAALVQNLKERGALKLQRGATATCKVTCAQNLDGQTLAAAVVDGTVVAAVLGVGIRGQAYINFTPTSSHTPAGEETFPAGYTIAFNYSDASVLSLPVGSWTKITLYDKNWNEVQTERFDASVLQLGLVKGNNITIQAEAKARNRDGRSGAGAAVLQPGDGGQRRRVCRVRGRDL